ncbi:hypothetical protein H5T51_04660 [Candidatus Bathyarchaeota archaeon]|nr:hypothetical protein [Candidatus Bathyarchaeota archaeon]
MKPLTRYLLSRFGGMVAKREEIEIACKRFEANPVSTINFMIHYGYFVRILRGLYYVKSLEEFKLKKAPSVYEIISLGMNRLKIDWYFGLYTALRLNGLTHEFFGEIFVLNNRIFRPKVIEISGERVKFVKLKDLLFGFGVVKKNAIRFSDPEKTILDFIYVFRYRGISEERIISITEDYFKNLSKNKLESYLKFYPKSVKRVVENAGLI